MYKSFRVKNFRCFKDLQINDLGRVNLIAGKNNTGKTALMEAMYLQTKPLKPEVWNSIQKWRDLDFATENMSSYWDQYFYKFDATQTMTLEAARAFAQQHSKLCITKLLKRRENAEAFERYRKHLLQLGTSAIEANKVIETSDAALDFQLRFHTAAGKEARSGFMLSTISQPIYAGQGVEQKSHFLPVREGGDKQTEIDQFSRLDNRGKLPNLIETLRIFEPQLSDLRLLSPYGEMLIWGRVNGANIPLKAMGDGINRFLYFAITMMSLPNSVICIDEIENGIHHSVQKDVWKAIGQVAREEDIQVFATTHSKEMLQAAHQAFKDEEPYEFRFHRLDRDIETGNVEAVTYNEFGMSALAESGFEYEVRG